MLYVNVNSNVINRQNHTSRPGLINKLWGPWHPWAFLNGQFGMRWEAWKNLCWDLDCHKLGCLVYHHARGTALH